MERNVNYPIVNLHDISIRLAWAQLEMYADDVDQIQVIASGDEHTLGDLRIAVIEDKILIEQPQYGITLDITHGHWMQLCVRVPKVWDQEIHANTISGLIVARGLGGSRIELETVTGDLKAVKLTAGQISLRTTTGSIHGDQLMSERLTGRSVSGDIALDDVSAQTLRFTSISGEIDLKLGSEFEQMDIRTVSGDCSVLTGMETLRVSMWSVSGRKTIEGVTLTEDEKAPILRATGVSGNLKIIGLRKS
jgi:DUF4097 and DUF4098 domain-containing protein YvlB